MERLYTPWRLEYIKEASVKKPECIFCIDGQEESFSDRRVLFSSDRTMTMCNRFPYTNGHLLISPREHLADFSELEDELAEEMWRVLRESIKILKRVYQPEGINVGMNMGKAAGAGFEDHVHMHVLPRWAGDTNFMTSVSEVRILPETVSQTYERLLPEFQALKKIVAGS